ncbi:PREDICTED: homeobox protein 13 [Rhagoletis zephyria]|uniref:homeobox protein 13 n=1 Tax=Rhagoletis zephyria TaxID=28612 RepID=UPI00081183BF|nr:PREDICTED: homeobox protein 13 [Rhagoletis zephyria]
MTLSQICRTSYQNPYAFPSGEISDELRRKFDQWWSQQLTPQSSIAPKMLPFLTAPTSVPNEMDFKVGSAAVAAAAAAAAAAQAGLHAASGVGNVPGGNMPSLSGSHDSLLMNDATHHGPPGAASTHHPNMLVHPAMHPSMHHHHHHPHSQYPNQKTRMRTSFDPEMELPKLQKWFQENPHPSRQQIQTYVVQLNALESRRGRKPLDVNNVVYWFKNARAAQKRAEMRGGLAALGHPGLNGFVLNQHGQLGQSSSSSGGSQQLNSSNINLAMSHDFLKSPLSLKSEDVDTMSQHSEDMDEDNSRPGSPQLPLSLTTHERNRNSPLEGAEGNTEQKESLRDMVEAEILVKSEADCQSMLNGSLNQSLRACSRSYTEEGTQPQDKPSEAQAGDQQGDNPNENTTISQQNETEHNNSNNNNNNNNASNANIATSDSTNNNNSNIINEQSYDAVNTQPQAHSSPKMNSPKEEDDDLDMEDDDDDENDASQLDDYCSPSPDLANALAQRKDMPFSMVPNSMFSQSFMYMSHYIPGFGQAAANHPHAHHAAAAAAAAGMPPNALMNPSGLNLSSMSNEERRKRNRTFIDPVTEVPKLEQWFAMNTHPSHNLILKYTEDLNTMPYRQKFPRLESKNVQFWFKNRRAKCKRLKMSLYDGSQLQGLNSFVSKYEERD